jgi:hypothetical protein
MVHLLLKEHQTGTRWFDALLRRSIQACYLMLWVRYTSEGSHQANIH